MRDNKLERTLLITGKLRKRMGSCRTDGSLGVGLPMTQPNLFVRLYSFGAVKIELNMILSVNPHLLNLVTNY